MKERKCGLQRKTYTATARQIHGRKGSPFNRWAWENCVSACRAMETAPHVSLHTIQPSKYQKYSRETWNSEMVRGKWETLRGKDCLEKPPFAQGIKLKTGKRDCIKLKRFGMAKEIFKRKDSPQKRKV